MEGEEQVRNVYMEWCSAGEGSQMPGPVGGGSVKYLSRVVECGANSR